MNSFLNSALNTMKMNRLSCVIHYSHIDTTNTAVTALKKETFESLLEIRKTHDALDGDCKHKQQSNSIPEVFDTQIHGYHQQCYQKYNNAISKFSSAEPAEISNKKPRRSGEF